ncbi:hypothetical protein AZI85_14720 [Bdellovibrio bacteriovorus]|uniref:Uncharacterized protein n=1 Tax=Bdellovibrio bacteriovorus TaxID=959 RepID=A0A150WU13_BDEBC|nr:hypothetical protein AZI85_14720 [Bdellovibrio bacteriovorus]
MDYFFCANLLSSKPLGRTKTVSKNKKPESFDSGFLFLVTKFGVPNGNAKGPRREAMGLT